MVAVCQLAVVPRLVKTSLKACAPMAPSATPDAPNRAATFRRYSDGGEEEELMVRHYERKERVVAKCRRDHVFRGAGRLSQRSISECLRPTVALPSESTTYIPQLMTLFIMLPSHLIDPTKKKNERLSHTRLGQLPPPPLPSLCVTGALSQIGRFDVSPGVFLSYCIFRPRQLHDIHRPPLIVVHGGPSIPSNYLLPIVNGVTDRSVIFYDQYGCGKSSRPLMNSPTKNQPQQRKSQASQLPPFSIDLMVQHLDLLIAKAWKLEQYFLLGHSFGGILAYEYLLSTSQSEDCRQTAASASAVCRGLILASVPTSSELIQEESKRLYQTVNCLSTSSSNDDGKDDHNGFFDGRRGGDHAGGKQRDVDYAATNDDDEEEDKHRLYEYSETFRQTHECRLSEPPLALVDALAQAGPTPWRGIPAIPNYQATQPLKTTTRIPTLLLRGEYDFCTDRCMAGWDELLLEPAPKRVVLTNCSHYSMLEDEQQFGVAIKEFLAESGDS